MVLSVFRAPIIVVLCLLMALASGCSALRIGYNQSADLAYWWLDGYVDFSDAQTPRIRNDLADWFSWHRRTQLPEYASLLARAQADVMLNTTPARACEWWQLIGNAAQASIERAVPAAANLVLSMSPAQVAHLERRYAKANDEFRKDFLQPEAAARLQFSVKRAVERAETLYGSLEAVQRERVAKSVADSPFDAELWFSERVRRQQDAVDMVRRLSQERASQDQAQAAVRAYIDRWSRSPREPYRRYAQALSTYNCAFAASLHNGTSVAQRQAAAAKLRSWEEDARALAAAASN